MQTNYIFVEKCIIPVCYINRENQKYSLDHRKFTKEVFAFNIFLSYDVKADFRKDIKVKQRIKKIIGSSFYKKI